MKTKLRVVKLQNGQYEVQAKWANWFDFFWHTIQGYDKINDEDQARKYMQEVAAFWSTGVVAVIEERTL